jgi:hypothetical protein
VGGGARHPASGDEARGLPVDDVPRVMGADPASDARANPDEPLPVVPAPADLERAIASVAGVRAAEVHRTAEGRDRLRISLAPGADPAAVSWAVAATLRERFAIPLDPARIVARPTVLDEPAGDRSDTPTGRVVLGDGGVEVSVGPTASIGLVAAARAALAAIEVSGTSGTSATSATPGTPGTSETPTVLEGDERDHAPAPGGGGGAQRMPPAPSTVPRLRPRAAITELVARPEGDDLTIAATLRLRQREVTGYARGLGTRHGRWRAIAEATLAALGELSAGQLRSTVDHVTVLAFPDLAHVTVSVTLLTERGEEPFLGAALIHDDPDRAVMRATLDAVNRRVEPWLAVVSA